MDRPLPQIHFVFTQFNVSNELFIFQYPLSWAIAGCAKEKNGKLSRFNLKEKRILSESNWFKYCIKCLEQKTWKSILYVYIMMENLN